ncbi:MAG: hydroxyacid dehydrogenase, partial [Nitrososphaeria archaeon]|nr:hydroxyacid dehydrogenase [Nitrososphaeria archaeon]
SISFTKEILDAAPKLKAIFFACGSVKPYITDEVWKRGIKITSAVNVNAIPVAEFTLGMILLSLKHVFKFNNELHEKGLKAWRKTFSRDNVPGYYKSTVGIVGFGQVSKHLIKLLQHFDLNILIYSKHLSDEEAEILKVKKVPLDELMSRSDVITVHAANIPQNKNLINKDRLSRMKDGATIINTSRGPLIDEEALINELKTERIYACLDVFNNEPPQEKSDFYKLKNCIITPHIAGSINNECYRLGQQVLREIKHYLAGEKFEIEITKDKIETIA